MSKYLISFRPVEKYFFGNENTFGDNPETQNYWVESSLYPQQTTLLGIVRYWMLICNRAMPLDKNKDLGNALIGSESFNIEKSDQQFGVINSISPLFIISNDQYYSFAPSKSKLQVLEKVEGRSFVGSKKDFIPFIKGYNPKEKSEDSFFCDNEEPLPFSSVFDAHEQVGIKKSTDGGSNENAFFRQLSYSLKEGIDFAFVADLNDTYQYEGTKTTTVEDSILNIGAEKSVFQFKAKKLDAGSFETIMGVNEKDKGTKLILLSDAIVDNEIFESCDFVIGEAKDFRFINIKPNNKGHYGGSPCKSPKYNLLKRGSVLYSDQIDKVEGLLNIPNLQKIGFNTYKIF